MEGERFALRRQRVEGSDFAAHALSNRICAFGPFCARKERARVEGLVAEVQLQYAGAAAGGLIKREV